jgi:hypothetical protein
MLSSRCRAGLISAGLSIVVYGCAGTYAAEGAKQGAVAGAVAGAVGSLFWGGNVLESAAVGAVTAAAAGAAVGGMTKKPEAGGQEASTTAPTSAAPAGAEEVIKRDRALEERIGTENFEAARLLGRCQHDRAIEQARTAYKSVDTDERRAYALMIEAVAAEEEGDAEAAAAVYPRIVELAPSHGPVDKVRSEALSGILKVQQARKAHGLPPLCA